MPTVHAAGPNAATEYQPEQLATVNVSGAAWSGHDGTPIELGQWPAWQVRAVAELLAHPLDPGTLLRRSGYQYESVQRARPEALAEVARMLLEDAENYRRARWARKTPLRLGGRFFHTRTPEPQERCPVVAWAQGITILSTLVDAHDALQAAHLDATHAGTRADLCEAVAWFVAAHTSRYPSIPPDREAELAAHGYTVAELLLDVCARLVIRIADLYERAEGANAATFVEAARASRLHAQAARKAIEQGVRFTMKGKKLKFQSRPGSVIGETMDG